MKLLRPNLRPHCDRKKHKENNRARRVPQVQRHGERVATGFAQRSRSNLDNPETDRDFRHFAEHFPGMLRHSHLFRRLIARASRQNSPTSPVAPRQTHPRTNSRSRIVSCLRFDLDLRPGSIYANTSASRSSFPFASFSDTIASPAAIGHLIPNSESFHTIVRSPSGE